jgi:hypothetical protein
MGGACMMHGKMKNAYTILVGKPEGKRPVKWPRCRWEATGNNKTNFRKAGLESVGWIPLGQGPVAGCYEHGNEPAYSIKVEEFRD